MNKEIEYKDIPLFDHIDPEGLSAILGCLKSFRRSYAKGETLLMERNHVQYVGIVLRGTVYMMKEDIWGDATLLTYMGKGELFGEAFAVQKETASYVTYIAATDVSVLYLSVYNIIHNCEHQCGMHAQLTQNMFDLIGKKSVRLMERIEVSSKNSLRSKILAYLSMGDRMQEVERLVSALAEIRRRYHKSSAGLLSQEYIPPIVVSSPQDAFYAEKESVPLDQSCGRVC